jgi:hypothetical protein
MEDREEAQSSKFKIKKEKKILGLYLRMKLIAKIIQIIKRHSSNKMTKIEFKTKIL